MDSQYQGRYEQVKNEIPAGIGVYVAIDRLEKREETETNEWNIKFNKSWFEPIDGLKELYCIRPARSRDLRADRSII